MYRPRTPIVLYDPHWIEWENGWLGSIMSVEDTYFEEEPHDSEMGLQLDALVVDTLSEVEATALHLRVDGLQSYRQIADGLGMRLSNGEADRKKAWRTYHRALRKLRKRLEGVEL